LDEFLRHVGVMGVSGIDTRALARRLRMGGACNGVLSTEILDDGELVRLAQAVPPMAGLDLVSGLPPMAGLDQAPGVPPRASCRWTEGGGEFSATRRGPGERRFRVVVVDCGTKPSVLRNLVDGGGDVWVVPASSTAADLLDHQPEGVFVSHGPGDPAAVTGTIQSLRSLLGRVPMFGLGLGSLLIALAMGGRTFKLPFGHHGVNHPVRNEGTGTVAITSQNHGFAADAASLSAAGAAVTHVSLNDRTVEGFAHPDRAAFGVQFLPDAAPGPHDATYLFDAFRAMMETGRSPSAEDLHTAQERQRKAYE